MNQGDEVSFDQLRNISVGVDWKRLARNLELEDGVVDNINLNKDYPTLEEKCCLVFQESLRKRKIGRKFLNKIFEDIGKHSLKIESCATKEENLQESTENSE